MNQAFIDAQLAEKLKAAKERVAYLEALIGAPVVAASCLCGAKQGDVHAPGCPNAGQIVKRGPGRPKKVA